MSFEIHPSAGLAATRWTSTRASYIRRAPFGGRSGGLSGCGRGCGCRACAFEGLGSIAPTIVREPNPSGVPLELSVANYVTSAGPFDPTRMITAMAGALKQLGYTAKAPKTTVYPLTWAWDFDAPRKVYQAKVVGATSGPFVRAMDGVGPAVTHTPTATDAGDLPSKGTVILFESVKLPKDADLNALLGELRNQKTLAARRIERDERRTARAQALPDEGAALAGVRCGQPCAARGLLPLLQAPAAPMIEVLLTSLWIGLASAALTCIVRYAPFVDRWVMAGIRPWVCDVCMTLWMTLSCVLALELVGHKALMAWLPGYAIGKWALLRLTDPSGPPPDFLPSDPEEPS